jgi:hypothetical protein
MRHSPKMGTGPKLVLWHRDLSIHGSPSHSVAVQ